MDSISQTSMRGDSVQLPRPLPPPFPSTAASPPPLPERRPPPRIRYERYAGEEDIPKIMSLVDSELSEPYNYYTYRYFLADWPHLCFMAYAENAGDGEDLAVGTIVCKQEIHRGKLNRGYLAMLSTREAYRGRGVATNLLHLALTSMLAHGCQEVVLETEYDNVRALQFYRKFGFIKDKKLYRFYLNAKDAYRLKLPLETGLWTTTMMTTTLVVEEGEETQGRGHGDLSSRLMSDQGDGRADDATASAAKVRERALRAVEDRLNELR